MQLTGWTVNLSKSETLQFQYDLAFNIVKYLVFNLLIVCVEPDVLPRYYLQMFTIYAALVMKLKIHTRTCQDRSDVGN